MTSKPPSEELLDVVREFMERDLLPALSPEIVRGSEFSLQAALDANLWFQCKIAINILGIVSRELELRQSLEAAEQQRLIGLLGEADQPSEVGEPGDAGSLDDLNRRLCSLIRNGEIGDDSPDLIRHLRATITGTLSINNPKSINQAE